MIIYGDFSNARSYLASLRVDRLIEAGHPALDWRAVEHRPGLPPAGVGLSGPARAVRCHTLAVTRSLLQPGEKFSARNTAFLPNTRAATIAYAQAHEAGVADQARRVLFEAHWVRGVNIGDLGVLRTLLRPVLEGSPAGGEDRAQLQVTAWQQEWLALATPIDLTVVHPHVIESGRYALVSLTSVRVAAA